MILSADFDTDSSFHVLWVLSALEQFSMQKTHPASLPFFLKIFNPFFAVSFGHYLLFDHGICAVSAFISQVLFNYFF